MRDAPGGRQMSCIPRIQRNGFEAHRVLYSWRLSGLGTANEPPAVYAVGCVSFTGSRWIFAALRRAAATTTPTRDVDITYQITRPGQPAIVERRRWLASQQLRRVDGSDNSATIFDQKTGEFTLLNAANHTYRTLEAAKRMSPEKGTTLKRGGEYKIAGQNCIDWSWIDDTEMHMPV